MNFKYKRFIACFIAMFFMMFGICSSPSVSLAAGTTKISVQINVKQNGVDTDVTNKTFYVALFEDAELASLVEGPKSVTITNASSEKVEFTNLQSGTYYIAQTDSNGVFLEEEGVDVSCSKTDNKVTVKDEDGTETVVMTYDYDHNPNETATTASAQATTRTTVNTITTAATTRVTFSTVTTTVSTTKLVTDSAKTADNSHIAFYSIVALFCVVAAGWIVYDRKKSAK